MLFAHHLEPDELVRFAREGLRVARHAFLIHDLVRHPAHLALSYLGFPLYRSRLTRHDAPASVRRAYTAEEIQDILGRVESRASIEVYRFYLFRMGVIVWKPLPPGLAPALVLPPQRAPSLRRELVSVCFC